MPSRALLVCLIVGGCSDPEPVRAPGDDAPREEEAPGDGPAYRVVPVEDPGSIAGTVSWTGERPELPAIEARVHAAQCGEQPSQALRISARGGVADAVLSLTDIRAGVAPRAPAQPPEMLHASCRLAPHVLAVVVGTPIVFRSEDAVMHNVHGRIGDRTVFDFAQPERGASARRAVDEPGIVRVVCDVHAWTEGWIHTFEHPYFTVSDADGRYRLSDIPPGQYVLRVWHEGWRVVGSASGRPRYSSPVILTRTVSVSAQQETALDFELSHQAAEMAGD